MINIDGNLGVEMSFRYDMKKDGSKWFKGLIRSYKRMMENMHPFKIMKDSLIVWRPCRRHANIHMNLL